MATHKNFVQATTTTTGTGDITLVDVAGFPNFDDALSATDTIEYSIKNGVQWETGLGTYNGSNVLERTTIYATWDGTTYDDTSPTAITLAGSSLVYGVNTAQNIDAPTVDRIVSAVGALGTGNLAYEFTGVDTGTGFFQNGGARIDYSLGGTFRWYMNASTLGSPQVAGASIRNINGNSTTTPIYTISDDLDTGFSTAGADTATITAGGVEGIRVTEASSVITVTVSGDTNFPQANDATSPTINFGDGDSGFYELSDDLLVCDLAGTDRYYFATNQFYINRTNGASLAWEVPSATNPVHIFDGDADTGLGRAAADQLSVIAGGVEGIRVTETASAITVDVKGQLQLDTGLSYSTANGLMFGDLNTGFYESSDNVLIAHINGATQFYWSSSQFRAPNGVAILNLVASASVPTLCPAADFDTGIGRTAADDINIIAGGIEAVRYTEASSHVLVTHEMHSGITASTTQTQGNGALLSSKNEVSTVATTNDTVTLPTASAGLDCIIINNGANTLQIFPASGDDLGAGVDTATTLAAGSTVRYLAWDSTNWATI